MSSKWKFDFDPFTISTLIASTCLTPHFLFHSPTDMAPQSSQPIKLMHSTYFVQFVEVSMLKTLKQMVLAVSDKVPVF